MNERLSRQSFLGPKMDGVLLAAKVGVVGLGGGGSHIVQQLAHVGFRNIVVYDADLIEDSNLNRLVGGTAADVAVSMPKVEISRRMIENVQPEAIVEVQQSRWQDNPLPLRSCDLIFGCVDGLSERRELEVCARRYLIPLIDIGMDIQPSIGGQPPRMAGQVALSIPGDICMTCMGILNADALGREAAQYGAAGSKPQVVWPNGVLASTAIGIALDLLMDWSRSLRRAVYLSYDGNRFTMQPHSRTPYLPTECEHFTLSDLGDPLITAL